MLLEELLEEYFKDKGVKVEVINWEVRIYKSKPIENIRIFKRDLERYISNMPCKKSRVRGLLYILFGVAILCLYTKLLLWD